MIFLGDVVFPTVFDESLIANSSSDFWQQPKLVNLESSVDLGPAAKVTQGIALRSKQDILRFFEAMNIQCVSMANNHVFDYEIDINQQISFLNEAGVDVIGAGESLKKAAVAYYNSVENTVVVSFGWNVIRCRYATETTPGVNPYEYKWVEKVLGGLRQQYPCAQLVAVFHWNYEFELYPQPADRQFAHHLIDNGVDAIIGHHAHVIQGFEFYQGKPIFYGLGNGYFPNGCYDGFQLNFPPAANQGLAVSLRGDQIKVYVTELKDNRQLSIIEEGEPTSIDALTAVSAFSGLPHQDYIEFFRAHRKKKKMLPIYKNFRHEFINYCYDKFVIGRQLPVDTISKLRGGSR